MMAGHSEDEEYILKRIAYNIDILQFVNKKLLHDKEFMTKVVEINGFALKYGALEIKDNKEIVMIALKNSDGFALKYASKRLRADREVVYKGITKWRSALQYASKELRDERNKIIDDYYRKHDI